MCHFRTLRLCPVVLYPLREDTRTTYVIVHAPITIKLIASVEKYFPRFWEACRENFA